MINERSFNPTQVNSYGFFTGLGHVKFWKMARTFTGLKLQGELGRFGKTEICDILGMCAMPDEKVKIWLKTFVSNKY